MWGHLNTKSILDHKLIAFGECCTRLFSERPFLLCVERFASVLWSPHNRNRIRYFITLLRRWHECQFKWYLCRVTSSNVCKQDENLALRRDQFSDCHLPSNRPWCETYTKERNGQHFEVQRVRLFRVLLTALYQQFYACFPLQNPEKTRNVVLYGRRRRKGVYRRILVKRPIANSGFNGQLPRKTFYKRLIYRPQLAQNNLEKNFRQSDVCGRQP